MADKELDKDALEDQENQKEEVQPTPSRRFNFSEGTLQLLKTMFMYSMVIILTLIVSYCVSSRTFRSSSSGFINQDITALDPPHGDLFTRRPSGLDWSMEEMIINTADEGEQHIVKASIVVSYEEDNTKLLTELNKRRTEVRSEIRNIIGAKKYAEINTTEKQKELVVELKERIMLVVGLPGIIEIYLKDFTVH